MILVVIYSCLIVFISKIQRCEGLCSLSLLDIALHYILACMLRVHDVFYKPEANFSISVFVGK